MAQRPPPEQFADITERVASGEYFQRARRWYDMKYLAPMNQRTQMMLVMFIAGLSNLFIFAALLSYYPITRVESFIVSGSNLDNTEGLVYGITDSAFDDRNVALAQFHLEDYLKNREGYQYERLHIQQRRVAHLSSEAVYKEYVQKMALQNPDSPIVLYQRNAIRAITPRIIELIREPETERPIAAKILYDATVLWNDGGEENSRHQVRIGFTFDPIIIDQETGEITKFTFKVTEYRFLSLNKGSNS